MTDRSDDEKRKPTMRERLEAHGIKVREPTGKGTVTVIDIKQIDSVTVIDIAEIDTHAGEHWLRPGQRHRGNPRLEEIRAKHRQRHLDSKKTKPT